MLPYCYLLAFFSDLENYFLSLSLNATIDADAQLDCYGISKLYF